MVILDFRNSLSVMSSIYPIKPLIIRFLAFKDVFFLSFGDMSPLLSILTYAAFAITLAGYDAPIVHN